MQGKLSCCRIFLYFITLLLLTGPAIAAEPSRKPKVLISGLSDMTGLVMDNRGNAYTLEKSTGQILCIPPNGEPMVYGKVDGTPTVLAVDQLRTVFVGTETGVIHAIMLDGTMVQAGKCAHPVSGLSIDRDGNLLVATGNGTILKLVRSDFTWNQ